MQFRRLRNPVSSCANFAQRGQILRPWTHNGRLASKLFPDSAESFSIDTPLVDELQRRADGFYRLTQWEVTWNKGCLAGISYAYP
jgi:hypothetical protein